MTTIEKVTCPFCSLHCSDLQLSVDGDRLLAITPACALGESGFRLSLTNLFSQPQSELESASALDTARDWLYEARLPLVVLSGIPENDAIITAVDLAKKFSAVLTCDEDCTGSIFGLAAQSTGFLTSTLGEMHNHSLVVLCGVDPARTHPRLGEVLEWDSTDLILRLDPANPLTAVRWLRLACAGKGEPLPSPYAELAARFESARSGLVIFGPEWLAAGQTLTTELQLWLRDLNRKNRWYSLYLAPAPNSNGVVEALLSITGHPGNMHFRPDGVDYSPAIWQAERLIQQGSIDLWLLVGEPDSFTEETLNLLTQVRTILISPNLPEWKPSIWIPCAQAGIDSAGLFQRMDGVPAGLRPVLPSQRASMKDLLIKLTEEVQPA